MDSIYITHLPGSTDTHKNEHPPFEYYQQRLVPRAHNNGCIISVYTVPSGKANCPYHYHTANEEAFYILNGSAMLRTPHGEQPLAAGDFVFFPTGPAGAHRISNPSLIQPLVYIDYSTKHAGDICVYPDSGKIGAWFPGGGGLFRQQDAVDYYEGE